MKHSQRCKKKKRRPLRAGATSKRRQRTEQRRRSRSAMATATQGLQGLLQVLCAWSDGASHDLAHAYGQQAMDDIATVNLRSALYVPMLMRICGTYMRQRGEALGAAGPPSVSPTVSLKRVRGSRASDRHCSLRAAVASLHSLQQDPLFKPVLAVCRRGRRPVRVCMEKACAQNRQLLALVQQMRPRARTPHERRQLKEVERLARFVRTLYRCACCERRPATIRRTPSSSYRVPNRRRNKAFGGKQIQNHPLFQKLMNGNFLGKLSEGLENMAKNIYLISLIHCLIQTT